MRRFLMLFILAMAASVLFAQGPPACVADSTKTNSVTLNVGASDRFTAVNNSGPYDWYINDVKQTSGLLLLTFSYTFKAASSTPVLVRVHGGNGDATCKVTVQGQTTTPPPAQSLPLTVTVDPASQLVTNGSVII